MSEIGSLRGNGGGGGGGGGVDGQSRPRGGLWVHNEYLVAGQCAIRGGDRDRSGRGSIRDSGPDIGGIDEFVGCGCAVEENLACIGEALSQDLHQRAGAPVSGQVSHERRQAQHRD